MSDQYRCTTELRRQAVQDHPTLNGIDFLEVLDADAPADTPSQQTLLVRCLKPVNLTGKTLRIEGGVRITPVGVVWAALASDLDEPFASLPDPDRVVVVRTDSAGDFSPYTLLVTQAESPEPPDDFDPQLSEVEFSFKVECPSEFDCRAEPRCPPETVAEPLLDYLAKDYASFRRLILDRLSAVIPDWRERNTADTGIAIVELLAYAGDYLSYFQDSVGTEKYLGTARLRTSVHRHTRLLDYPIHDGCNARAWVVLRVEFEGPAELSTGTPLLTSVEAAPAIDEDELAAVLKQQPEVFETMHPVQLRAAHNELRFYTWGEHDCCLPKGATRATLIRHDTNVKLGAGDVLLLEEVLGPESGLPADADPARRHVVRLTRADTAEDPLTTTPIVRIAWHEEDALPFPLCLSAERAGEVLEHITVARGNVVLADHGLSVEEVLPAVDDARFRPILQRRDLSFSTPYEHKHAAGAPAACAARQDPRGALPAIQLNDGGETWKPRRDLLASDRFAPEFVVEVEGDGTARLRFGDGVFGREAPTIDLTAAYRAGKPRAGNVGAEAIAHVVWNGAGVEGVRNPLPAAGGVDPEAFEQARMRAPQAFRTQDRAVTEADYAAAAERHPQVQRAVATRRWTGSWSTMFVTVDRAGGQAVDAPFEAELRSFLERFRLAGYDLEVDGPRFIALDVAMTVCLESGYFGSDVRQVLRDAFSSLERPSGRRGFFHPDRLTFGQPVYLSQVVATAMQVPGVRWVDLDDTEPKPNRFRRWGEPARGEYTSGRISLGRLEIARLDNDPNRPENGRLEFLMVGGL